MADAFLVESSVGIEYLRLISSFLAKAKLYKILSNLSSTDPLKKINCYEEFGLDFYSLYYFVMQWLTADLHAFYNRWQTKYGFEFFWPNFDLMTSLQETKLSKF